MEIKDLIFIFLHISDVWFAGIPGAAGVRGEERVLLRHRVLREPGGGEA